jgi:hypothetical protein
MLGLPLAIAIIGGEPARFAPLAEIYRGAGATPGSRVTRFWDQRPRLPCRHGRSDNRFPPYAEVMSRIGRERGWPPLTRARFDQGRSPHGQMMFVTPDETIEKILAQHEVFGHQRTLIQMQGWRSAVRAIELLGTVVAPAVRVEPAKRKAPA